MNQDRGRRPLGPYPYPYNYPQPRPGQAPMAQGLPDDRQLISQLMAIEDQKNAQSRYEAPAQIGSSGTSGPSIYGDIFGFESQGVILDSAIPTGNQMAYSPNTFHDGRINFAFPEIGSDFQLSNVVGIEGTQFMLPQKLMDTSLYPDYFYDQLVCLQIQDLSTSTNPYQPTNGNGATLIYSTDVPGGVSIMARPMSSRVIFNKAIPKLNRFNVAFFRLSSRPGDQTLEPIDLPKTNIAARFVNDGSGNLFQIINGDTCNEFITQSAYAVNPTYKAAVYINIDNRATNNDAEAVRLTVTPTGFYSSSYNYTSQQFRVDNLSLPLLPNFPGTNLSDMVFIFTIRPNRITLFFNIITRTGAKTNDLTFVA